MKTKAKSLAAALFLLAAVVFAYQIHSRSGPSASAASATAAVSTTVTTGAIDEVIENAYTAVKKSVVYVDNPGVGTGSGVVYDVAGDIVTNDHVVTGGKSFTVTFSNGKTVPATLVAEDVADDLAVLHVNAGDLTPATFASSSTYREAETVLAVGSPLGLQNSVTSGLISGLHRTQEESNGVYIPNAIQTSAPINPGNSGGALVDLNGDVVGIPTLVQTSTTGDETVQDIGFAIPSGRVVYVVNQILKYGKVVHTDRPYLGVSLGDSTGQSGGLFGFYGQGSAATGAVVETTRSNGPAAKAGIVVGDVITTFNGTAITSSADLLDALAKTRPGESVRVTFSHNGVAHTTTVTLSELPA